VVPFPVERARRRNPPRYANLLDLERELDERKRASIRRVGDPEAGSAPLTGLMRWARPRAFAVGLVVATVSVVALEVCQGAR